MSKMENYNKDIQNLKNTFDEMLRKRKIYDETGACKNEYYKTYSKWISEIEKFFKTL